MPRRNWISRRIMVVSRGAYDGKRTVSPHRLKPGLVSVNSDKRGQTLRPAVRLRPSEVIRRVAQAPLFACLNSRFSRFNVLRSCVSMVQPLATLAIDIGSRNLQLRRPGRVPDLPRVRSCPGPSERVGSLILRHMRPANSRTSGKYLASFPAGLRSKLRKSMAKPNDSRFNGKFIAITRREMR